MNLSNELTKQVAAHLAEPSVKLKGKNLIYGNRVESEKIELPSRTLGTDPLFSDPASGLFSIGADAGKGMGLASPEEMQKRWKKWQTEMGRKHFN